MNKKTICICCASIAILICIILTCTLSVVGTLALLLEVITTFITGELYNELNMKDTQTKDIIMDGVEMNSIDDAIKVLDKEQKSVEKTTDKVKVTKNPSTKKSTVKTSKKVTKE